eukprot:scaffold23505_cov119-Cylindrotheca_fusiformis.AAC.2
MLNARVEIDTEKIPYKVKRKMPSFLDPYFEEHIQWIIFCDNLDHRLRPYEHIKAAWTIIGAIFTLLLIGFVVGIFCSILVVDDPGQSSVLAVSLAGGLLGPSGKLWNFILKGAVNVAYIGIPTSRPGSMSFHPMRFNDVKSIEGIRVLIIIDHQA